MLRQVTQGLLDNLRTGFKTDFKRGEGKIEPTYLKFSTKVNSTTKIETYGWLGTFPKFREWVGEKRWTRVKEKAYKLINKPFEVSQKIHKHDIADDNLGMYPLMFEGWGQEAAALPDRLAYDALRDGHLNECYDGQNFFDADHPMGDGVASNTLGDDSSNPWYLLVTVKSLKPVLIQEREAPKFQFLTDMSDSGIAESGEYPATGEARYGAGYTFWQFALRHTGELNDANYNAAVDAMLAFTDDEGEPLEARPDMIVVGRTNRSKAKKLFEMMLVDGGDSNINYKDVEILNSLRLA